MGRRGAILGLALLCALALSAISASGALAGATGFTCVEGSGGANTNGDCEPGSTGKFGHLEIVAETPATLTLNKLVNPVITLRRPNETTLELAVTGFECVGCTAENVSVGGVMEAKGGGKLQFTGVTVPGFPACTVVGSATGVITTQPLQFKTTSPTEVTFEPVTAVLMMEFSITGESCIYAHSYVIDGKIKGLLTGAKFLTNVTISSHELSWEGRGVGLKAQETVEEGLKTTHHPVALTTA